MPVGSNNVAANADEAIVCPQDTAAVSQNPPVDAMEQEHTVGKKKTEEEAEAGKS